MTTRVFRSAEEHRWCVRAPFGDIDADFIGIDAFIRNKKATGRAKDLGDIEGL